MAACFFICALSPALFLKYLACISWFILSGPMVANFKKLFISIRLAGLAATAATPAPGKVILLVEQNS